VLPDETLCAGAKCAGLGEKREARISGRAEGKRSAKVSAGSPFEMRGLAAAAHEEDDLNGLMAISGEQCTPTH